MTAPVRALVARCVPAEACSLPNSAFEPAVAALENVTPQVEVSGAGTCAFASRGPSRYFGGDGILAELVVERMSQALGGRAGVRVGIADGPFTAAVAAELTDRVCIVEPGGSGAFLAPLPVRLLGCPQLTDVLVRLGVRTLGAFAALPETDVLGRFGTEGRHAWSLAAGMDERSLAPREPLADWSVSVEIDPPTDRLDRLAFCASALAEQLHRRLEDAGMSCLRVAVEVETLGGESLVRLWRHQGGLSAADIADRVRWQFDGRLAGAGGSRQGGGVARLRLVADELAPVRGRQLGFWGAEAEADERAARVTARLCGRLGADAVKVPARGGGRHVDEQIALVPAAAVDIRDHRLATDDRPWPGRLPPPSPARLLPVPWPAEVQDASGAAVRIDGRGSVSAPPARLEVGERSSAVLAWAGPWPTEEHWWDRGRRRRRARLQLLTDDGLACLAVLERGRWRMTAVWD